MPEFHIQHVTGRVTADNQTFTLPTPVAALDRAFVWNLNSRFGGAVSAAGAAAGGVSASEAALELSLTSTTTVTARHLNGAAVDASFAVVEYIGPTGGPNEFVVRDRSRVDMTNTLSTSVTMTTPPASIDQCVPFINGATVDSTSGSVDLYAMRAYCSGADQVTVESQTSSTEPRYLHVTTVEFVGTNWTVGHAAAVGSTVVSDDGTIPIVSGADGLTGSSVDVGSWRHAAVINGGHTTTQTAIVDHAPMYNAPELWRQGDTTNVAWQFRFGSAHNPGTGEDFMAHVIVNPIMDVWRVGSNANGNRFYSSGSFPETTEFFTEPAGVTDLNQAVATIQVTTANTASGFRAFRNTEMSSLTKLTMYQEARPSATASVAIQVIDMLTPQPACGRRTTNMLGQWDFQEGAGTTVADTATGNPWAPHDLTIQNPGNVTWLPDGLRLDAATLLNATLDPALVTAIQTSDRFTAEMWVTTASLTLPAGQPARMFGISADGSNRNFSLTQGHSSGGGGTNDAQWGIRMRRAGSNNGTPGIETGDNTATLDKTHVVFTFDGPTGHGAFYINGFSQSEVWELNTPEVLDSWDTTYPLNVGGEADGSRYWLGTIHYLALYDDVLTGNEVECNYEAGSDATIATDVPWVLAESTGRHGAWAAKAPDNTTVIVVERLADDARTYWTHPGWSPWIGDPSTLNPPS